MERSSIVAMTVSIYMLLFYGDRARLTGQQWKCLELVTSTPNALEVTSTIIGVESRAAGVSELLPEVEPAA
jgi:hypothetical protein